MLLYCVRHGESTYNLEGRVQGQSEVPLSERGRAQAEAVANHLATYDIEVIYTSPLTRAMQTAEPIAAACHLQLTVVDALKEIDVGVLQEVLHAEMAERYPEETARWRSGDPDYRLPEGESRRDLMLRGGAAFEEILAAGGSRVVVVSHGLLLASAFKVLLGLPADRNPFELFNASISRFRGPQPVKLLTLNETGHLAALDSGPPKMPTGLG
jgi:broad specificity phosphatase PhoE